MCLSGLYQQCIPLDLLCLLLRLTPTLLTRLAPLLSLSTHCLLPHDSHPRTFERVQCSTPAPSASSSLASAESWACTNTAANIEAANTGSSKRLASTKRVVPKPAHCVSLSLSIPSLHPEYQEEAQSNFWLGLCTCFAAKPHPEVIAD